MMVQDKLVAAYSEARAEGLPADDMTIRAFEAGGTAVISLLVEVMTDQDGQSALVILNELKTVMLQANEALNLNVMIEAIRKAE